MSLFKLISSFNKNEIRVLFKTARTVVTQDGLIIKIIPKKNELGRILIVIPQRYGNAPQRNLLRRRLKSIFFEEKLYQKSYDCIIFASKEAAAIPFSHLKELLIQAMNKDSG